MNVFGERAPDISRSTKSTAIKINMKQLKAIMGVRLLFFSVLMTFRQGLLQFELL